MRMTLTALPMTSAFLVLWSFRHGLLRLPSSVEETKGKQNSENQGNRSGG
jgi:hypothetical protein